MLILKSISSDTNFVNFEITQRKHLIYKVYSSRVSAALKSGSGSDLPLQQKILLATLLLMTNYAPRKCKEVSGHSIFFLRWYTYNLRANGVTRKVGDYILLTLIW